MEFFLGNSAQQTIFQLLGHVYGMAKLTENPDLLDLALWLAQSDNLIQQAEISSYLTPGEWSSLDANGIMRERQQVCINALYAMEPYLPARLIRRARRRSANKMPRRRNEPAALESSFMARREMEDVYRTV
jgi:alpha-amylase